MDDIPAVTENPSLASVAQAFRPPADSTVTGRPLLNLSFALNRAAGGFTVFGYHAVNLAIHAAAGMVLFGIVWRLARAWAGRRPPATRARFLRPPSQGGRGFDPLVLAFGAALLWELHPLQTEAVTYVSQRAESLMGLFCLLTVYCFLRTVLRDGEVPSQAKPAAAAGAPLGGGWGLASVLCCYAGVATKEVMVTAPALVLLVYRTFVSVCFRAALKRRPAYYAALASSWVLLVFLMQGLGARGVGLGEGAPWCRYVLTEAGAIWHYVRLALWPHPLVFDYGDRLFSMRDRLFPVRDRLFSPEALVVAEVIGLGIVLGMIASELFMPRAAVRAGHLGCRRAGAFFGAAFCLLLAPTSVIPVVGQPVAEHRMYLPLALVAVAASWIVNAAFRRAGLPTAAAIGFLLAVGLALGAATARRNRVYRSELALWQDTVRRRPENARAQNNLGEAWTHAGNSAAALACFRRAVALEPRYAEAHSNLSLALERSGDAAGAVGEGRIAVRLDPVLPQARVNLANALREEGAFADAIAAYQAGLRLKPSDADAWNNLAIAEAQSGDLAGAARDFAQAVRFRPAFPQAHYNWGNVLRGLGRDKEAAAHYRAALELAPGYERAAAALRALGPEAE